MPVPIPKVGSSTPMSHVMAQVSIYHGMFSMFHENAPHTILGPLPLFDVIRYEYAKSDHLVGFRSKGYNFFAHQEGGYIGVTIEGYLRGPMRGMYAHMLELLTRYGQGHVERSFKESVLNANAQDRLGAEGYQRLTSSIYTSGSYAGLESKPQVPNKAHVERRYRDGEFERAATMEEIDSSNDPFTEMYEVHNTFPVITPDRIMIDMYIESLVLRHEVTEYGRKMIWFSAMLRRYYPKEKPQIVSVGEDSPECGYTEYALNNPINQDTHFFRVDRITEHSGRKPMEFMLDILHRGIMIRWRLSDFESNPSYIRDAVYSVSRTVGWESEGSNRSGKKSIPPDTFTVDSYMTINDKNNWSEEKFSSSDETVYFNRIAKKEIKKINKDRTFSYKMRGVTTSDISFNAYHTTESEFWTIEFLKDDVQQGAVSSIDTIETTVFYENDFFHFSVDSDERLVVEYNTMYGGRCDIVKTAEE